MPTEDQHAQRAYAHAKRADRWMTITLWVFGLIIGIPVLIGCIAAVVMVLTL
jgi:hypothetical protein